MGWAGCVLLIGGLAGLVSLNGDLAGLVLHLGGGAGWRCFAYRGRAGFGLLSDMLVSK